MAGIPQENTELSAAGCIGVLDSGLGGLSIVAELLSLLPHENILYYADNHHLPYGPRPLGEVRCFATAIAGQLIRRSAKVVVVACNTASAAALCHLRAVYPQLPFVGMEPAVKPAAAGSRTGKVGVLATQATFQGLLFEKVVERFAAGVEVVRQPCPGLAEYIERYPSHHPALFSLLQRYVAPLVAQGVDSIVLGCTHYPLVKEAIQAIAGPDITVVDPSPAIARRTEQVLREAGLLAQGQAGRLDLCVSGERKNFSRSASRILQRPVSVGVFPPPPLPASATVQRQRS
ncbi:MAG: glutamate racemase [Planctomycetes bacterium]|nr:glutamate racemase [Planctomycetota bacterium]